ncbi:hypothetical protein GCM10009740_24490 [Terrabacter terrae]|uniref:DUF4282 domain-containing protein n=1 Tax=Terrabacter terrae TaxID=318434 RepID=A0ABN2UBD1_9MICO
MSDPNPPEQPSFNLPAGSRPTTPIPSGEPQRTPEQEPAATPPPPPPVAPPPTGAGAGGGSSVPSGPGGPTNASGPADSGGSSAPSGLSSIPDPTREGAGFFTALFDFSFTNFVTPILVRIVYLLATVALVALWVIFVFAGFANSVASGLVALVLGPVLLVIYLAIVRMTLEFYLSVVRMSEDIHKRLPHA